MFRPSPRNRAFVLTKVEVHHTDGALRPGAGQPIIQLLGNSKSFLQTLQTFIVLTHHSICFGQIVSEQRRILMVTETLQ